jgi:hypothetical protein
MYDTNISDDEFQSEIRAAFTYLLQNILDNENDVVHLDFKIVGKDNYFKIVGKNAITAVWLSGIFPKNSNLMLKNNTFIIGNRKYNFNEKTCKLTYTIIKNG